MNSDELIPARLVAPGTILKDELDARGWTQKDFSEMIDLSEKAISAIVNGKKRITPETALKISAALGTRPAFWMKLEADYQLQKARHELDPALLETIQERSQQRLAEDGDWRPEPVAAEAEPDPESGQANAPRPYWPHLDDAVYRALIGAGLENKAEQLNEQLFARYLEGHLNQANAAWQSGYTRDALRHLAECHDVLKLPARVSGLMQVLRQTMNLLHHTIEQGVVEQASLRRRIGSEVQSAARRQGVDERFYQPARREQFLHERVQQEEIYQVIQRQQNE